MARLNSFQITLLTVWGTSAIAALGSSFWLTGSDWSSTSTNTTIAGTQQSVDRIIAEPPQEYKEEALALRESVQLLERRNRILTSRLDALESDIGTITASVPTNGQTNIVPLSQLEAQQLPQALPKSMEIGTNTASRTQDQDLKVDVQPFPLKMPGTNRAPNDSEIGEALLAR